MNKQPDILGVKFETIPPSSTGICGVQVPEKEPVTICGEKTDRMMTLEFKPTEDGRIFEISFSVCLKHLKKIQSGESLNFAAYGKHDLGGSSPGYRIISRCFDDTTGCDSEMI